MSGRAAERGQKRGASGAAAPRAPRAASDAPELFPKGVALPELDEREAEAEAEDEDEDEEDEDEFPELDAGDDPDEGAAGTDAGPGSDADGGADAASATSEEGFDSDEIDNWDEADDQGTWPLPAAQLTAVYGDDAADAGSDESDTEAALSRMVAQASGKPEEDDKLAGTNRIGIDRRAAARFYDEDRNEDASHRARVVPAIAGGEKLQYPAIEPEYDSDSSTEETTNRIGNVPLEWYDDLPHLGYDIHGQKVMRPARGDELDKFLSTVEGDGDAWFSAHDKQQGRDVRLTDEELDIIQRLQRAEIPDGSYDPYEPATDWFTQHQRTTPLTARPEPKRRFVPSKWEHKKIMKIVRAIRQGRILPHAPGKARPSFYNIWSDADQPRADHPMHMPAPKQALPTHAESYNPPQEYLFNDAERREWEDADPADRKLDFVPAKYGALRLVPRYDHALQERFQRCLDLYMAPRMRRARLEVDDAEQLLPKLPSPRELRPFPTHCDVVYAHAARVRAVAPDPTGNWLLTGAEDGRLRLWDLALGRCVGAWDANTGVSQAEHGPVYAVQWCPNRHYALAAAVSPGKVTLLAPPQCGGRGAEGHVAASAQYATAAFATPSESENVQWVRPSEAERAQGVCVHVFLRPPKGAALVPKQVRWHARGDYFATVCPDAAASSNAVLVHQVTRHRSQAPFRRTKHTGSSAFAVQCVAFHPARPLLFVATQRYVRVFDLVQQTLHKTLQPGVRWISSLDVHPSGDHVLVGSYDRRLLWFDLDLSERPYKALRYHSRAVRSVAFHPRYPLFASAADDATVHVYHATVYSDLSQNALLVPLKILRGHSEADALGVLSIAWHPTQPWLLSGGADRDARLWTA